MDEEEGEGAKKELQLNGPFLILPFERDLLLETMDKDVLFVSALGLGVERLFLEHLIMLSTKKTLALVLNTNQHDENYFISQLRKAQVPCEPKILNSEVLSKDREAIYLEGGVQFITSRILTVDLLTGRIPIENVACILVYRAHKVLHSFQESFILRLYREKKRVGMVKAFTDVATASISSFGQLQRAIDRLYLKHVRLVPRFDREVKGSIDENACRLSMIDVSMPDSLRRIQRSLCEIISVCLKDLKLCSISGLQNEEEHNETGLRAIWQESSLEKRLLDRMNYLNEKQKRLLYDLGVLRALLRISEGMDIATLLIKLNTIRNDSVLAQSSTWLMSTTASKLISDIEKMCTTESGDIKLVAGPPKWKILAEVLEEIKTIPVQPHEVPQGGPSVLIMATGEELCKQLQMLIKNGEENLLWYVTRQCERSYVGVEPELKPMWNPDNVNIFQRAEWRDSTSSELRDKVQKEQKTLARAAQRKRKAAENLVISSKGDDGMKQTRLLQFGILQYKKKKSEVVVKEEPQDSFMDMPMEPTTSKFSNPKTIGEYENVPLVIMPQGERYSTMSMLEQLKPTAIILYNLSLLTARQIEMFHATHPEHYRQIYCLQYKDSTEESRYLDAVSKENEAFDYLFKEIEALLIPREYDTSREMPRKMASTRDMRSRVNIDEQGEEERPKIIVDMREFNSELPTVLYKQGFEVVAATLEIGDYILCPTIAVERKALDDLTQSLQSSRVFKQAEQMLRHYKNAILLIESNQKFATKLVNGGPFQGELSRNCREVRKLLCSLVRSYPVLRIVWSLSPTNSAEYFSELKLTEQEPELEKAIALKSDDQGEQDIGRERSNVDEDNQEDPNQPSTSATSAAPAPLPVTHSSSSRRGKANAVMLRHLSASLPRMARGDVENMMTGGQIRNLHDLFTMNPGQLQAAVGSPHADRLALLATFDFSQGT